ncbi:MAG: hypothetical protein PUC98_08835 [Clostridiales bacterium]|nr:hypothetical protein [Clostridiales bacterium]
MGKKTVFGVLGSLILAGAAVGAVKYLKDYAGVKFTDDDQIDDVKNDSKAVKESAKRTYFAIREKKDVKEAAAELSKAAGAVVSDAAEIAKTAGSETVHAIKDLKEKYNEDPDGARAQLAENLSDMTRGLARRAQDTAANIKDKLSGADEDDVLVSETETDAAGSKYTDISDASACCCEGGVCSFGPVHSEQTEVPAEGVAAVSGGYDADKADDSAAVVSGDGEGVGAEAESISIASGDDEVGEDNVTGSDVKITEE